MAQAGRGMRLQIGALLSWTIPLKNTADAKLVAVSEDGEDAVA
jgi:hypothetical protein